jgi:hypothetical protein
MGVDRIGLMALAGVEHADPGRQLRWHVQDRFAVGDQTLGEVPTDPGAAVEHTVANQATV